ncbi:RHH-type proline utilization regulon transcriptional repressor/proline dehydrogenase/delta 1-pyrroline-5-carboxylate dehydrogenase [Loktanella ponticola]|uniref:Bifunctional protein PutA n=1 Tax=Yoonia ponticola TaxID=1524255 RepID=A0A7W9BI67_9RHOB|nr:bifunctional proline dehydrogenase/L-glutamate gamma-semialdehyde dehydrogenase PutA [Yoonia ponticola]MBB5720972.1 RHH-type proline utilization regulon transcriptional repressor/proline dehydrogenase/delta 1-pyrroline-5-carboxylate dehydrogenase [Yoonia ponticola]
MENLTPIRLKIRKDHLRNEDEVLAELQQRADFSEEFRSNAVDYGINLVNAIRNDSKPGLMEIFLAEYGLSTNEGIALMCLAEALLRVPDADTIDALIEDKIAPSAWGEHLGKSSSSLVNASTWALMLTGKVLKDGTGMASVLRSAVKRLGEPVIRVAASRAMKEMGAQFVLGETIERALERGRKREKQGYTYSYDMLGEAALTAKDAIAYFDAYANAINALAGECKSDDIRENPGISIKLSALHPRYEVGQQDRVMRELTERILKLTKMARDAGMGLNIDAEEAARLDLSLDVIAAVLADESLQGWDGFGVVVQAYGKRASGVIDWLHGLATQLDRKIMVRLVKGAYWDTEIKNAQVEGLDGFPVFSQKSATDVSYICCAKQLLGLSDRIYPQFATHNAHSIAAIFEVGADPKSYEFQRLHGMGVALYDVVLKQKNARCRIYAPVGAHKDLLAYLVRRLLENGANSSFVNQIVDKDVPPRVVAADPFAAVKPDFTTVRAPSDLFTPERLNSKGWDIRDRDDLDAIDKARSEFSKTMWRVGPLVVAESSDGEVVAVQNPAKPSDLVGLVQYSSEETVKTAIENAQKWDATPVERAEVLNKAADLYEQYFGTFFALLAREAGKTHMDAIAELREAVDFLRYYAARATELTNPARGIFTCISPWNFPLAIFTGQVSAALAAGNGVLAKPAEATTLTGVFAAQLLHEAGVPVSALQLITGEGRDVGAWLTQSDKVNGVCFTGSTRTAQAINRNMAEHMAPTAPLIAETGGLNAMIVDSTALPEQAIRDIVASAFQSAGQRCSALRVLYVQDDVADLFLEMLFGVMDEQVIGDPWDIRTDLGPLINQTAKNGIEAHVNPYGQAGRVLKHVPFPAEGHFVPPCVIAIDSISELKEEVFGPVLHVVRFESDELDQVIADINATGFGLTFGIHTRIDDRVTDVTSRLNVGNIYVNRNQIGAVVGSQPFGGEGLSGTGPKAGGPDYVTRFTDPGRSVAADPDTQDATQTAVQTAIDATKYRRVSLSTTALPGPTGESNMLSVFGRGKVLCLGPGDVAAAEQAKIAESAGCAPTVFASGVAPDVLTALEGVDVVVSYADDATLSAYRGALAARDGKLIPLIAEHDLADRCKLERHICIDTTAAGGNATLLASV